MDSGGGEEHPDADPEAVAEGGGEAAQPRRVATVQQPTREEIEEHRKFHMPYRNWCCICVQSRGKNLPHRAIDRSNDGTPIVDLDFFFPGTPEEGTIPAVAARDSISKSLLGHVVPSKGETSSGLPTSSRLRSTRGGTRR